MLWTRKKALEIIKITTVISVLPYITWSIILQFLLLQGLLFYGQFFPPVSLKPYSWSRCPNKHPSPNQTDLDTPSVDLLYFIWLLTSWPAARADIRESSPAKTAPEIIVANRLELSPGDWMLAPFTPSRFKQADWEASCVPPPTVPTCKQEFKN